MDALHGFLAPTHALRRLAAFLQETDSKLSTVDAAAAAINEWIARQRGQLPAAAATPTRGYQWKSLFLPEGTELRITAGGTSYYARVEGDDIIYNHRPVSPRQMAIAVAGEGRNAWREIRVLLPGERAWRPASALRRDAGRSHERRRGLHVRNAQDRARAGRACQRPGAPRLRAAGATFSAGGRHDGSCGFD